jgi:hypothetical protein
MNAPPRIVPGEPPSPKPMYPDTPWWAVLVAVAVTAIVCVMGTAYALGGTGAVSAPKSLPPAAAFVVDTITYMPHILLLFGVLSDMFTYQGVWSIPSLVGILSIPLNYFMQYFWKGLQEVFNSASKVSTVGSTPPATGSAPLTAGAKRGGVIVPPAFFKNYDGCSVQGFEGFRSDFAPQTLVVTATVFCYYIFDLVRNRGWLNSVAAIVMFGIIYVMQTGVLIFTGGCGGPYGNYAQGLMALFEGIVFGGSAYGIIQTYYPTRLPSTTISPFPRRDKSELTMGPDGKMYDADGYPYVILPNGQAVPDLSTQNARNAFATIAGQNLGTGLPAKPNSCPL